ncbi:hypothetical protein ACWGR2_19225, partial [Streptomyces decoyicus]
GSGQLRSRGRTVFAGDLNELFNDGARRRQWLHPLAASGGGEESADRSDKSFGHIVRRLLDTGAFTPHPTERAPAPLTTPCRPARPVVQLLYCCYLAPRPLGDIQRVAQTCLRRRCMRSASGRRLSPVAGDACERFVSRT